MVNLSGQGYRAILVPPVVAISQAALDQLKAFAQAGGKVFFLGGVPQIVMGRNFLTAKPPGNLGWATHEELAGVTAQLLAALPAPEVAVGQPAANLKYNHRHLKDGEAYYLFNEGDAPLTLTVTLTSAGRAAAVQDWSPRTGDIRTITGARLEPNHTTLPIELAPWETKLVVITAR